MDLPILKARLEELFRSVKSLDASTDIAAAHQLHVATKLDEAAAVADRDLFPAISTATDADLRDEAARLYRQMAVANSWLNEREERSRQWIDKAVELATSEVLRDLVVSEQNGLRDNKLFPEIRALCQQGLVDKARRTLLKRRRESQDPVMRRRIDEALADPRSLMGPLGSAPTMSTINGFGLMLHGNRAGRPDGTYVATLCIVALFIPILPLRAYLIQFQGNNRYVFYGRVPLSPLAFWWRRFVLLAPLLFALGLWGVEAWDNSDYIRETTLLSQAGDKLSRNDYAGSLASLSRMPGSGEAGRSARRDELYNRTLAQALAVVLDSGGAAQFLGRVGAAASQMKLPLTRETLALVEAALGRIDRKPEEGYTVRNFVAWMGTVSPEFAARLPEIAAAACATCDDPVLLAATLEFYREAGRPVPDPLLSRLFEHLSKTRHRTWDGDALSYLRSADPGQAAPILQARSEAAWKGTALGTDLLPIQSLLPPLRRLIELDAEPDLEKRAAGLEKAAAPGELTAPLDGWHRLGVARRLAKIYGLLNEKDPLRFPVAKARPWAIQAAEFAPEDAELRVMALRYLVEDGDYARAISLGSKGTEDPRVATLMGVALARSGKLEEAATLLRPCVERELPPFCDAVQQWEKAVTTKTEAVWRSLENGSAPRSLISRLNSLPKDQASREAQGWVQGEVDRDAWVAQIRKKWSDKIDIHAAASELAMIELSIGRSTAPGPDRTARLEAAEKLFLDLRKISHDDPHQELQLGQVYFWLGKDKEGTEIFDRLEKAGETLILFQLGEIYRTLSNMEAARRVLESAYAKADDKLKGNIASRRAMSTHDHVDRLAWLRKANPSDAYVRIEIDNCEAHLALNAGKYEAAIAPLQRAAAFYSGQPDSSTNLNNGAIALQELAIATGDPKYDLEALRMMRRAHELVPEEGIVLSNYVHDLQKMGLRALAGTALRAELLHEPADADWFDFMAPLLSSQDLAARVKSQPEMRRASELAEKSMILSPDSSTGYTAQSLYFSMTQDLPALRRLRESVEAHPPKRQDETAEDQAHARGIYTESEKKQTEAMLARCESHLTPIRKAGHAPTLSYALKTLALARLGALRIGIAGQTLEAALRDAEEAASVFNAPTSREVLARIRMESAGKAVAAVDEEFGRWAKENPSVSEGTLLPLYVRKHPDRAPAIRDREDVKLAAREAAAYESALRPRRMLSTWAWLEMCGHDAREKARKEIAADVTILESTRLRSLINLSSPAEAVEAWLAATALGDLDAAGKIAEQAKAAAVLPRFFTK